MAIEYGKGDGIYMFMCTDCMTTLFEIALPIVLESFSFARFEEASGYVGESHMTKICWGGGL